MAAFLPKVDLGLLPNLCHSICAIQGTQPHAAMLPQRLSWGLPHLLPTKPLLSARESGPSPFPKEGLILDFLLSLQNSV